MKLLFFNASIIEQRLIAEWSATHGVSVKTVAAPLSHDNIGLTHGYDALIFYPSRAFQTDATLYQQLAQNGIKQLSIKSTGYDNINLTYAQHYQLTVTNVPNYSPESVAHFTIMSILMLLRQLPEQLRTAHTVSRQHLIGKELTDVTVGIYGAGRLGSLVAKTLHVMGARVLFYARTPKPALTALGLTQVNFETLLTASDVLSIHVPLNETTYHRFNAVTLGKMKDDAILINTARGSVIDTAALIRYVRQGKFSGLALDALENEDTQGFQTNPYYQALQAFENVILTPHIAYYTSAAVRDIVMTALDNAYDVISTGISDNVVLN